MMIPSKAKRMASKPVIDLLIHTIRPRGMPEYLKLFEELALPVARRHLGEPLGYYVTQIGPLNQVVHLWAFESLADMEQRHPSVTFRVTLRETRPARGGCPAKQVRRASSRTRGHLR
jgi:hypothetical protein